MSKSFTATAVATDPVTQGEILLDAFVVPADLNQSGGMSSVAIVLGERADLAVLASAGDLWAEDTVTNRTQIESLWKLGVPATLFQPKEVTALIEDVDMHHPNWSELRILRA